eukprot:4276616-Karenia_brevis.AAC.1
MLKTDKEQEAEQDIAADELQQQYAKEEEEQFKVDATLSADAASKDDWDSGGGDPWSTPEE